MIAIGKHIDSYSFSPMLAASRCIRSRTRNLKWGPVFGNSAVWINTKNRGPSSVSSASNWARARSDRSSRATRLRGNRYVRAGMRGTMGCGLFLHCVARPLKTFELHPACDLDRHLRITGFAQLRGRSEEVAAEYLPKLRAFGAYNKENLATARFFGIDRAGR